MPLIFGSIGLPILTEEQLGGLAERVRNQNDAYWWIVNRGGALGYLIAVVEDPYKGQRFCEERECLIAAAERLVDATRAAKARAAIEEREGEG